MVRQVPKCFFRYASIRRNWFAALFSCFGIGELVSNRKLSVRGVVAQQAKLRWDAEASFS